MEAPGEKRLSELKSTKEFLNSENQEYIKYREHLRTEGKGLMDANEKLLSCLKNRHTTYVQLINQDSEMDESMVKRQNEIDTLISHYELLLSLVKAKDRNYIIEMIRKNTKKDLLEIRNNLEYDKYQHEIEELTQRREEIETETRRIQSDVDQLQQKFERSVKNSNVGSELQAQFTALLNKMHVLRSLKSDQRKHASSVQPCEITGQQLLRALDLASTPLDSDTTDRRLPRLIDYSYDFSTSEGSAEPVVVQEEEEPEEEEEEEEEAPDVIVFRNVEEVVPELEPEPEPEPIPHEDFSVQTVETLRTKKSAVLTKEIAMVGKLTQLQESVYESNDEISKLEQEIDTMISESNAKKRNYERLLRKLRLTGRICSISVKVDPPQFTEIGTNCEPIASLEELKDRINTNSSKASQRFIGTQEKRDLEASLRELQCELKVLKMANTRKEMECKSLVDKLQLIDPSYYAPEGATRSVSAASATVDPSLLQRRDERAARLKRIEARIAQAEENYRKLISQIEDARHINKCLKKKISVQIRHPRYNVRDMCGSLKDYRSDLNVISRLYAFNQIMLESAEEQVIRMTAVCSQESLTQMRNKNSVLSQKLCALKHRFNSVRAVKEQRSITLTSEEEFALLQGRISELTSAIDVYNMRMSGLTARVNKLTRDVVQQGIPLPPH